MRYPKRLIRRITRYDHYAYSKKQQIKLRMVLANGYALLEVRTIALIGKYCFGVGNRLLREECYCWYMKGR